MKFNLIIILSVLQFCEIIGCKFPTPVTKTGYCNLIDYDKGVLSCENFTMADINDFTFPRLSPNRIHVSIKHLLLSNSHIDYFTKNFFGHFYGSLQEITAIKCNISDIIEETFRNIPHVKRIDFQSNVIEELRSNAFSNINKLIQINLSNNSIETIDPETFENLTRLENINLVQNKLRYITSNTFKKIKNINNLNIQNNPINSKLRLNFNNIERLTAYSCGLTKFSLSINSGKITTLALDRNNLKEIVLPNIKVTELDLSYNKITRLDKINVSELKELNLDGNPLDHDNIQNDFENMTKLVTLSMANTNLRKLNKDMFKSLDNIEYLDIRKNPLEKEKELEAIKEIPNLTFCTIIWPSIYD